MNTIIPLSAIPTLGSSPSHHGGHSQQGQAEQSRGDILKATVLEIRSNNRFLLDFNGTQIVAASKAPLIIGQQLQLQVAATSPQLELSIVSDFFSALAGKPLVLLGTNIDLGSLFNSLKQGSHSPFSTLSASTAKTFETFLPPELKSIISSKQGGEFILKLFNRLGINLEGLLAQGHGNIASNTLKASLLEILHRFQGADHITEQAGKLLATLELYQLAQLQLSHQNQLIFPLPLPFFEQGYLLIEQEDDKDNQSPDEDLDLHYSLHVAMTALGNIKIEFFRNEEGLFIRFNLESREKSDFISKFTNTLKSMITSTPVISITFTDKVENPATELVRKLLPRGKSILDTTA